MPINDQINTCSVTNQAGRTLDAIITQVEGHTEYGGLPQYTMTLRIIGANIEDIQEWYQNAPPPPTTRNDLLQMLISATLADLTVYGRDDNIHRRLGEDRISFIARIYRAISHRDVTRETIIDMGVQMATGPFLDEIGALYNIHRLPGVSDNNYRARILEHISRIGTEHVITPQEAAGHTHNATIHSMPMYAHDRELLGMLTNSTVQLGPRIAAHNNRLTNYQTFVESVAQDTLMDLSDRSALTFDNILVALTEVIIDENERISPLDRMDRRMLVTQIINNAPMAWGVIPLAANGNFMTGQMADSINFWLHPTSKQILIRNHEGTLVFAGQAVYDQSDRRVFVQTLEDLGYIREGSPSLLDTNYLYIFYEMLLVMHFIGGPQATHLPEQGFQWFEENALSNVHQIKNVKVSTKINLPKTLQAQTKKELVKPVDMVDIKFSDIAPMTDDEGWL